MIAEAEPSNNTDESPPAPVLSAAHRRQLVEESSNAPEVVEARGCWTATRRDQLAELKGYQRRVPALVQPTHPLDGSPSRIIQTRPDNPRVRDGKPVKYETPAGTLATLDVHPTMHAAARDSSCELWITEGIKKADALTSRGLCTVGLIGVWNWQRKGVPLPEWDHIALAGRLVYVVFDADVMVKEGVQLALQRLVAFLEERGAEVRVIYLPGPEKGVDDALAAGATVAEIKILARKFLPVDVGRIRLSRDDKLRAAIRELHTRHDAMPATRRADNTGRAIMRALINIGARSGKLVPGGLRVVAGKRKLAELAAVSDRSVTRNIDGLERDGYLMRDNAGRKIDQAGAFILPITGKAAALRYCPHDGERGAVGEKVSQQNKSLLPLTNARSDRGGDTSATNVETVPELRWPTFRMAREQDEHGRAVEVREYIARLGKKRGEIVAYLVQHGGTATVDELMERFAGARTRPYDFKCRTLAMLAEGPVIVTIEDDRVTLAEDWRAALDDARMLTGEIDGPMGEGDDTRQKKRHALQRAGWRYRDKHQADPVPEMIPIDDLRRHWGHHPEPCACRECTKRFGRVIGEHAEGCACAVCFERRRKRGDNSPTPAPPEGTITPTMPAPTPEPTPAPAPVPTPEPEPVEHGLACECPECEAPAPVYARPARSSGRSVEGTV